MHRVDLEKFDFHHTAQDASYTKHEETVDEIVEIHTRTYRTNTKIVSSQHYIISKVHLTPLL